MLFAKILGHDFRSHFSFLASIQDIYFGVASFDESRSISVEMSVFPISGMQIAWLLRLVKGKCFECLELFSSLRSNASYCCLSHNIDIVQLPKVKSCQTSDKG